MARLGSSDNTCNELAVKLKEMTIPETEAADTVPAEVFELLDAIQDKRKDSLAF